MALRFFADHCISKFIIESLQKDGHHVFRLKDHLPVQSSDAMVIARAQELDALLLSLNATSLISWPIRRAGSKASLLFRCATAQSGPGTRHFSTDLHSFLHISGLTMAGLGAFACLRRV
jgi:hypothetical protein